DYHVFLIHSVHNEHWVYDFDAVLEFPSSFADYCVHGLLENEKLPECLRRQYRVVPGSQYLAYFASDRRHMRRSDGEWIAPPPSYDYIRGSQADSPHTLPHYLNMNTRLQSDASCYGLILDEETFFARFT
ncbi:protein N-terminal glutamine amidohydrolase, partial [Clonorchis sinensis]